MTEDPPEPAIYSDPVDAVHNPFEPGAGRPPAALVGRDDAIGQWQANLQRIEAGRSGRPVVLYGLRGVGKAASSHARSRTHSFDGMPRKQRRGPNRSRLTALVRAQVSPATS